MLCSGLNTRWLGLLAALALAGCSTTDMSTSLQTGSVEPPSDQRPYAESLKAAKESFARSDFGLAERDFRAAIENNPKNVAGWLGLAASYDHLHRFDLAERAYDSALQLGGRTPQYLNNLGYHYLLMGNRKRADEYLRAAAELEPRNPYITANVKIVQAWTDSRRD